jgi:hypothetical protein
LYFIVSGCGIEHFPFSQFAFGASFFGAASTDFVLGTHLHELPQSQSVIPSPSPVLILREPLHSAHNDLIVTGLGRDRCDTEAKADSADTAGTMLVTPNNRHNSIEINMSYSFCLSDRPN